MNNTIREINQSLEVIIDSLGEKYEEFSIVDTKYLQDLIYINERRLAKEYMGLPKEEARRTAERIQLIRNLWRDYISRVRFEELKH